MMIWELYHDDVRGYVHDVQSLVGRLFCIVGESADGSIANYFA